MRILRRSDPEAVRGTLFESEQDRKAQQDTMMECLYAWEQGFDALDLGRGYPIDYCVVEADRYPDPLAYRELDHAFGHVEIKRRHVQYRTYPTVFLEVRKRRALFEAQRRLGGSARFVVRYDDGIYWIDMENTVSMPVVRAGRTDRNIREDIDLCVDVPIIALTHL